jgi:hypothetical protein
VRCVVAFPLCALTLVSWGAASCEPPADGSPDGGTGLPECFYGDEGQEPEGELVFLGDDFTMQDLVSGQAVPLMLPPQGGKVVFIGARLRNMDLCSLQANGGVFDDCPAQPRIIGRSGSGVQMVVNDAAGLAEPAAPTTVNNYLHIPLCGNFSSSRDIDGEPYRLEVRFSDRARRSLVLRADITPFCPTTLGDEAFARCTCECDADFGFEGDCDDIIVDDDRPAGTCPVENNERPLPVCVPACDAARVCAETAEPGVGECR